MSTIDYAAQLNGRRRGPLTVGRYYGLSGVASVDATPTANRLRLHEFWIDEDTTFDRVGTDVRVAAAATTLRWVTFRDSKGYPGELFLDTGAVGDASTTGFKEATINQFFPPGKYWTGCVAQGGNPTLRSTSGAIGTAGVGLTTTDIVGLGGVAVGYFTAVDGAAPAQFPAGGTTTHQAPMCFFRKAA